MREPRLKPRELEALAEVVGERMGLHYPPAKWPDLERALAMAAPGAGFESLDDLVTAILTETATEERLGSLASCLTVGETYFFRDPKSFSALERQVLPELARRRAAAGVLRIWSAGCSDGAEPYSIAISCSRALPLCGSLEARILATDIDHSALDRARSAVYTKWSLRDMPPAVARDFFRAGGDQRFELRAGIRDKVRFAYQNLVAADQMRPAETTNVDLIFCRNVLMYFSPQQRRVAADGLQESLAEGGYLFVAPCEVAGELFPLLELVQVAGVFCFRKTKPPPRAAAALAKAPAQKPPPHDDRPPGRVALGGPAVPAATSPERELADRAAAAATPAASVLARAQALADSGRTTEALALCEGIATEMKLSAPYHFLRASVLQELDRQDDAAGALRRVLYLDPDFALAHFVLGNMAWRAGEARAAGKHFATLSRILEALPADSVLPASDGTTAGELQAMVRDTLGRR